MQWLQELEAPNSAKQVYKFSLPALDLMGLLGLRERLLKGTGECPGCPTLRLGKATSSINLFGAIRDTGAGEKNLGLRSCHQGQLERCMMV